MSILFDEFSSICLYLNKIGIVPTLMGSLGLGQNNDGYGKIGI